MEGGKKGGEVEYERRMREKEGRENKEMRARKIGQGGEVAE